MSSGIILDARKIMAMEAFQEIGTQSGREQGWLNTLWDELIEEPMLMKEFMYYVDHGTFSDEHLCRGYGMTDLYVFQMSRYNLIRDIGKNTESCNKLYLVLGAFHDMYCMLQNPDKYVDKLSAGPGMDRY